MNEFILPSGAKLNVNTLPDFATSRALFKSILKDVLADTNISREIDPLLIKDLFCKGLVSQEVETALWRCFDRVTYNGIRIDKDTFEKEEARQDYIDVCWQVAERNLAPFLKGLLRKLSLPQELSSKFPA